MTLSSLITPEQEAQFHQLGYCVVDGLFSPEEIDSIEECFEDPGIKDSPMFDGQPGYQSKYGEADRTKHQIRAIHPHRHDPRPLEWFLHPNIAAVLEQLLGKPALGVQTMYYYKPPGGRGQGMHQDNFYLLSQPHTCIAAWTAIDAADEENGCLWVVPKSNHGGLLCPEEGKAKWQNYGDSHITKFPRDEKPIPVPVPRGSTMFFGGDLIHGSGPNRTTDRFRRTFIGHYIDEASEEVAKFYHPVLNMRGEVVSQINTPSGGGACSDGWEGAVH